MINKTNISFLLFLSVFSLCAIGQIVSAENNFALAEKKCISTEETTKNIEQKKQQIMTLLDQSVTKFYDTTAGYAMFAAAAGVAILSLVGIYTYEAKKKVLGAAGFDLQRGIPITYIFETTAMPEAERQSLILKNKATCLLIGGVFSALCASFGYYLMNYQNGILQVATKYQKEKLLVLEIEEYNAINKWFNETVENLKTNKLVSYLHLVDIELARAFFTALEKAPDNFMSKCEFALHTCMLLKLIEKMEPQK